MPEAVEVSHDNGILALTLNRPERKNALTVDMVRLIVTEVESVATDGSTRAVLIRATGPDFCTGIDLVESNRPGRDSGDGVSAQRPRPGHLQRGFPLGPHRMIQSIMSVQLPVVAAVRGWAVGIGNALALSADFTIASEGAKFWVPFATRGFTPDSGNSWLVPRLVGLARAKQILMLGRPVEGPTAADWGLVGECVPDDEVDARASELATELAALPTVAIGLTKVLTHTNLESGFVAGMQTEGIYEELGVRTDDFKEGLRAFSDKRAPNYTGR